MNWIFQKTLSLQVALPGIIVTKKVILLAAAKAEKKSGQYVSFVANIDPFERKMVSATAIYPTQANEKNMELFGRKHEYTGMPQNLFINNDGSFSVVYEEIIDYSQTFKDGASTTY